MRMKLTTRLFFSFAMGSLVSGWVLAGDLQAPPGPPAPTMATLQEIHNDVHRKPDTCFVDDVRFMDCGDGTVKDALTGLIWLKNASCLSIPTWAEGSKTVAQLGEGTPAGIACGLQDGSKPGDWRLPTLSCPTGIHCTMAEATGEFASIFKPSCPAPSIPGTSGGGCWTEGHPFVGVQLSTYWSATTYAAGAWGAWGAPFDDPASVVGVYQKSFNVAVWPVRGGKNACGQ